MPCEQLETKSLLWDNTTLLWDKRETARQLGVGTAVVEKLMRTGELPFMRFSDHGAVRFRPVDVAEYIRGRLERRTQKGAEGEQGGA
jgi:hypothetical protein